MHHDGRRQPHRHRTAKHRPPYGQSGYRINPGRQAQQRRYALDVAANVADRAGAQSDRIGRRHEPRHRQRAIDGGIQERVHVVVGVRHVVQCAQTLTAPHVAAPHQENRCGGDPVHRADPVGDLLDPRPVPHHHHGELLQIRFRRGRLRRRQQRVQQRIRARPVRCSGGSPAGRSGRRSHPERPPPAGRCRTSPAAAPGCPPCSSPPHC